MPETVPKVEWFTVRIGEPHGPLSDEEMHKLLELGHVRPADLIWRTGFSNWQAASVVFPQFSLPDRVANPAAQPQPTAAGPDIFVSYARKDWSVAASLVKELEARRFNVWWDRELIAGEKFNETIAEKLDAARAVIVLWSKNAARSDWVNGEASRAFRANKLIATHMPGFRMDQISEDFRSQHSEPVKDLDRIVRALGRLGVSPTITSNDVGRPAPGDRIARSLSALRSLEAPGGGTFSQC